MATITNYRISELYQVKSSEEMSYLAFVLMNLKPIEECRVWLRKYRAKNLKAMTFGQVTELKTMIQSINLENQIKMVSMVFEIPKWIISRMRIVKFFQLFNHVTRHLEKLVKGEQANLKSEPDSLAREAGIDRLDIFGVMAVIDELADGNLLKWRDIENTEYRLVFSKLMLNKTKNEIRKDMEQIMKRRAKASVKRKW